eukprot:TRINITY_DN781_c0_g2_i2.p1 TRINITY_DN781_c0_g2~~TRINITY_DN781_c0_g2_i2.p1  ORF type:complete len:360 (+),score=83.13 TRINITY_DN781_c0_g2_i2:57-1082(+)
MMKRIFTVVRRHYNVLVTRPIPDAGPNLIRDAGHTVRVIDGLKFTENELIDHIHGKGGFPRADALVSLLSDPLSPRVLEQCTHLKIIAQYAVGLDNIHLPTAKKLGIPVSHTPGVLTDATADQAFALLLAASRFIVPGDQYVRAKQWKRFECMLMLGADLSDQTIGIIGMGRIGQAMARRALGFGMKILYHNTHRVDEKIEKQLNAKYASLDELLKTSDFVSLHCPLTAASRHLISAQQLAMMKPSAILVNTARGPVVNEADLAAALKKGLNGEKGGICAAGLDVFEKEPLVHSDLLTLSNVVLAPHLGSATIRTRSKMSEMCGQAVVAALSNSSIPYRAV